MSGKIYKKNFTFLQDQPFAENFLTGLYYKKRGVKSPFTRDSSFPTQLLNSDTQSTAGTQAFSSLKVSFSSTRVRTKSEKMKKAETSLIKHFCLILERTDPSYTCESLHNLDCFIGFKIGSVIPHLLVSVDSMQGILLATRGSRSPERIKTPSQFKKILRECRKIRLLYGNLSMRHLSRATSKMRLPGENLLLWLESRLDVVLERCGFFGSVKAARQSVLNGKILVNSKVVKSPGFILEGGDLIKIVQERLLFDSLHKKLSRGVILSNKVFPSLLRNEILESAVSKILPNSNSTLDLKPILSRSAGYNKIANRIFDSSRFTVQGFSAYKSFYTWLLKKKEKNFQPSEYLGRQSKALLATELQYKILSSQNPNYLDKKILSLKNWRFKGSPHLLFSLFFLHARLQRVMFSIAQTCNKNVLHDKEFVKHKIDKTQKWNNISLTKSKITRHRSELCSTVVDRGFFNFPTISSVSKYCVINTLAQKTVPRIVQANKIEKSSIDTSKIKPFFNLIQQSFKKNNGSFGNPEKNRGLTSRSVTVTNFHNSFGEEFVRVLTEVYNNLLTRPWYICLNQDERLSKDQESSLFVSNLITKNKEDSLLCVLFSDLLLYSLLIKKEVGSIRLKKERLESKNQKVSRVLPDSKPFSKKQKTFGYQIDPNLESPFGFSRVLDDNSRFLKADYKKFNLNDNFDISQAKRIKPLHLEVSYQSLCAVYLFPPQRICLPVMVDMECLAKAF